MNFSYKSKLQLLYQNNNTKVKIGENNVLYQKCEGHIGVATLITRINKVGGTWVEYIIFKCLIIKY